MDASDFLDAGKENIQPLKQGRMPSILTTALQSQTPGMTQELRKQRNEYEVKLRSYNGNDPLEVWYEYVQWVEQSFPGSSREGNLKVLLERCLSEYKDVPQYSQDGRYVDLWIKYITYVPNSLEMFKQVNAYGIGSESAPFYKNWADALEAAGDFKRADNIYKEGIARNAQPLDELNASHCDFMVRVARYSLDRCSSPEVSKVEHREALSRLKTHGQKHTVYNVRIGNNVQSENPGILRSVGNAKPTNKARNKQNDGIKICNDENVNIADVITKPKVRPDYLSIERDAVSKENTKKPGRWNEGKFKKQKPVHCQSSFPVLVDDAAAVPSSSHQINVFVNALKPRKLDEEQAIPLALFEPPDPTKRPMYDRHKVYAGGTEFSFEELRALRYKNIAKDEEECSEYLDQMRRQSDCIDERDVNHIDESPQEREDCELHALCGTKASKNVDSADTNMHNLYFQNSLENGSKNVFDTDPALMLHKLKSNYLSDVHLQHIQNEQNLLGISINVAGCGISNNYGHQYNGTSFDDKFCISNDVLPAEVHDNSVSLKSQAPNSCQHTCSKEDLQLYAAFEEQQKTVEDIHASFDCSHVQNISVNENNSKAVFTPYIDDENEVEKVHPNGDVACRIKEKTCAKMKQPGQELFQKFSDQNLQGVRELKLMNLRHAVPEEVDKANSGEPYGSSNLSRVEQSFTVNTKEAMNAVQGLFQSPQEKRSLFEPSILKRGPAFSIHMSDLVAQEQVAYGHHGSCGAPDVQKSNSEVKDNYVFKMPVIPYIPSPGRTKKELAELEVMGNKENKGTSEHKNSKVSRNTGNVLQPSKRILLLPDDHPMYVSEAEQEDLGFAPLEQMMSDETCTTEAFSCPLLSSTPFFSNMRTTPVHLDVNESSYSGSMLKTENIQNDQSKIALEQQVPTHSAVMVPTISSPNSIVTSESSSEKSSSCSNKFNVTVCQIPLNSGPGTNVESLKDQMGGSCANNDSNMGRFGKQLKETYPLSHDTLSKLLKVVGFPASRRDINFSQFRELMPNFKGHVTLGEDEYVCQEFSLFREEMDALELKNNRKVTLKVAKTTCPWEYYIAVEIRKRLKDPLLALRYMNIDKAFQFRDGIVMVTDHCRYGNLYLMHRIHISRTDRMLPMPIIIHWTCEMLDIVNDLHKCNIIHGDLTLCNFKIQNISAVNEPSLKLSNYQQAIDMTLLPPGTEFNNCCTVKLDIYECVENLINKHWTYQIDLFKLAASVYYLLCGVPLQLAEKNGQWLVNFYNEITHLRLWADFFNKILNVSSTGALPDIASLRASLSEDLDQEALVLEFQDLAAFIY